MIKELAAACLANMLCGMEEVSAAVVRLGADRVLRAFLNSPTAAVQVLWFARGKLARWRGCG